MPLLLVGLSWFNIFRASGPLEPWIDDIRLVIQYFGKHNPMAGNDTEEGRSQNRRVEIAIGGI